ncbi:fungal specific transcription factor domain-containing protein [Colletotrichum simmondsii]|uniref:Fungal specific transcription factor domain-containing protein n=1 Tax=Colletotrichum simmondsii TaxID=703756 RepID=A0A135T796_9PEZI|nr:fungal specific transcription factor domain-containing protein [Colletotrichum simmondsii]
MQQMQKVEASRGDPAKRATSCFQSAVYPPDFELSAHRHTDIAIKSETNGDFADGINGNSYTIARDIHDPAPPLDPRKSPHQPGLGRHGSHSGRHAGQTRSSLKQLQPSSAAPIGEIGTTAYCGLECSPPLTAQALETCLIILRHVPDRETGLKLFDSHLNPSDGWIRLAAKHMMISLYDTFPQYFPTSEQGQRPDDAQLTALARTICGNTAKCVSDEESDPAKWMAQFTGTNLRWESLGVMFAYWELAARYLGPYRPDVGSRFQCVDEGTKVVMQYRYCLGACIELTKAAGSGGNTLLLFMCSKRTIIESLFSGDASFACWQLHAETVALSTFLGFHDEVAAAPGIGYKPTVCSEIKRKLFSYVFYVDKVLASFAGRPPLISRRYARTPPPLDLKDDHLLSNEASLARHVAALDENGWNTKGELYSATIVRARVMLAHIRDEIFEIALGQGSVTLVETLLEIKERQLRTVAGFPDILTLKEEDVQNRKLDISLLYTRLIIKLEHLQNMFFIERLLAKRGHDDGALLSVSFEMVSKTLMFWTNMDRLSCMNGDFEWLVMAYAAPGGGILCMELLKPTLQGGHHPQNPQVSRSSIIQKLSLLVGFLDWVSPTAPNGDLCADCKVIIQRVLDQALNSPAASASSAVDGGLPAGVMLDVPMDWDFSTQLDFNFDLLDTFDWLRPEVSSSQQSS